MKSHRDLENSNASIKDPVGRESNIRDSNEEDDAEADASTPLVSRTSPDQPTPNTTTSISIDNDNFHIAEGEGATISYSPLAPATTIARASSTSAGPAVVNINLDLEQNIMDQQRSQQSSDSTNRPNRDLRQSRFSDLVRLFGALRHGVEEPQQPQVQYASDPSSSGVVRRPSYYDPQLRTTDNNEANVATAPSSTTAASTSSSQSGLGGGRQRPLRLPAVWRSLLSHSTSSTFRYSPLEMAETGVVHPTAGSIDNRRPSTGVSLNLRRSSVMTAEEETIQQPRVGEGDGAGDAGNGVFSRQNSVTSTSSRHNANNNNEHDAASEVGGGGGGNSSGGADGDPAPNENAEPPVHGLNADMELNPDNEAMISEAIVTGLRNAMRYLPFLGIFLLKFIYDHFMDLLNVIFLNILLMFCSRNLRLQIANLTHKNYLSLARDFVFIVIAVGYSLYTAQVPAKLWCGLLVPPPEWNITTTMITHIDKVGESKPKDLFNLEFPFSFISGGGNTTAMPPTQEDSITSTTTVGYTMGTLIYYLALNDILLKLLTVALKMAVTVLPENVIRQKQRARMYALLEYVSQFIRLLVPVRLWLEYLYTSYSGYKTIPAGLFCLFYIGFKGFEAYECVQSIKKSLMNFLRNLDYERKPTKDELDNAGTTCPICHDNYNKPVILECNHIFCDGCVSTWFKREQTCPMCRAKVSDDPTWQDGRTSLFLHVF